MFDNETWPQNLRAHVTAALSRFALNVTNSMWAEITVRNDFEQNNHNKM